MTAKHASLHPPLNRGGVPLLQPQAAGSSPPSVGPTVSPPTLELWGAQLPSPFEMRQVGLVWGRRTPAPLAPAPFDASNGPKVPSLLRPPAPRPAWPKGDCERTRHGPMASPPSSSRDEGRRYWAPTAEAVLRQRGAESPVPRPPLIPGKWGRGGGGPVAEAVLRRQEGRAAHPRPTLAPERQE